LGLVWFFYDFFWQRCIKLIKSDSKDIYNVTKHFYFKWMMFSFIKNPEKKCITVFTKILSKTAVSTLIIIINVSWAVNQHIRMISEGSCDIEDWSNDSENSALPSKE